MEAVMRGQFSDQGRMFSYVSPEARVPAGHPLRAVRAMVREGRTSPLSPAIAAVPAIEALINDMPTTKSPGQDADFDFRSQALEGENRNFFYIHFSILRAKKCLATPRVAALQQHPCCAKPNHISDEPNG
jgi:hypothetical protein